jgi:hypothetical protein
MIFYFILILDPEVRIYHDCNDHGLVRYICNLIFHVYFCFQPCQREWVIRVPNKYIYSGKTPKKFMDLGVMNLEVELEDEDQDCLHWSNMLYDLLV